jgi:hypothetical protein
MQKKLLFFLILVLTVASYAKPGIIENHESVQVFPNGTLFNGDYGFLYEDFNLREPLDFDSSWVSFEGNWPFGASYSISSYAALNLAFVGSGGGVYITDISDPENPVIISEIRARSLVDGSFYDVDTQRLYLAAYFSGVEIWDLSDIYNPARLGRCPTEPYPRAGIYASGDYVFAATVANGLRVIDVSDPTNPYEVADCPISYYVWNMAVSGNYIYLTGNSQGLQVIDISNPLNPHIVANYPTAKGGIFISEPYAYFAENGYGLKIFNIADPLNAYQVGSCTIDGYPAKVVVFDNHAFVAGNECGLLAINVENPENPYQVDSYSGYYQNITGEDGYVYLSGQIDGFLVFDVTNPASIQYVTGYSLPNFASDVAVSGDYIYTGSNGFRVIDVSDPTYPIQVGYSEIEGGCVAAAGLYVVYCPKSMGAPNPVNIMNVEDPTNPFREGFYTCPAMTYNLAMQESLAFVACWWDGMRIINFQEPSSPYQTGHVLGWFNGAIPGEEYCYVQAVDVQGNYAYIIDYGPFQDQDTFGLYIIDISNPVTPFVVIRYTDFISHGSDIDVEGDYVYIADSYGGMEVINIANPNAPFTVDYCELIDAAQGIHVSGDYAYVANYIYGGVQVFYIANPQNPVLFGWYQRTGCFAMSVTSSENHIYVADGIAGIQIYNNLFIQVNTDDEIVHANKIQSWNYPNPFNPTTIIRFNLTTECTEFTELQIYNLKGQKVKQLVSERLTGSEHSIEWDGTNDDGKPVSSGVYFYKIKSGGKSLNRKMLLLK